MLVEQCALTHIFSEKTGCALIGAFALIRMNMVYEYGISCIDLDFQNVSDI